MNKVSLSLSVLAFILAGVIQNGEATNPAVMLSATEEYYDLDAIETIRRKWENVDDADTKTFPPVALVCCPKESAKPEKLFVINVINNKTTSQRSFDVCDQECKPIARRFTDSGNTGVPALYKIGYEVCDPEGQLEKKGLKSFSENCDLFSTINISFDESALVPRRVKYDITIEEESFRGSEECDDFDVGKENFPEELDMENLYTKEVQDSALENVYELFSHRTTHPVPTSLIAYPGGLIMISAPCHHTITTKKIRDELQEEDRSYFIAQTLASKLHFRDDTLAAPVCTYYNTAPMWEKIADFVWKPMQDFVKKIAEVEKIGKLSIISGTYGKLSLLAKGNDSNACPKKDIYLGYGKFKMAVPRTFYTLVMHHFRGDTKSAVGAEGTYYGMILVAENDMLQLVESDRCDKVPCEDFGFVDWNSGLNLKEGEQKGWAHDDSDEEAAEQRRSEHDGAEHEGGERQSSQHDPSKNDSSEKKVSYCCAFTKENLSKFNIIVPELGGKAVLKTLDLQKVPVIDKDSGDVIWINVVKALSDESDDSEDSDW